MNLLQQTKDLCNLYDIKPARSKGQNFLIKEEIYNDIIATAYLKTDDVVLEVGPGLGFLTAKLARQASRVIAVELDDKLAEILHIGLAAREIKNVDVVNEDILKIFNFFLPQNCGGTNSKQISDLKFQIPNKFQIQNSKFKIVANLPYNITSIFLRKILSAEIKPSLMVLMLQKEVAERIVAKPPDMSLLAVSVQFYAYPEIVKIVAADNFWPMPAVDSAIVKFKIKKEKAILNATDELKINEKDFFRLIKIGFSSKRKMLKNNLMAGYKIKSDEVENKLKNIGLDVKIRAERLTVADWQKLLGEF
ncbi:MAG: 16S rRNA (adenine(1518)-N(6)/adenine(1519)-N(6))-dimethyltransferase RsmA [Patescibacteria group bacterium]